MGYAIAEAAVRRGAKVTLISGPTPKGAGHFLPSKGARHLLRHISVVTADEMYRAVMKEAHDAGIVIMAAAVSDYRPVAISRHKIKKRGRRIKIALVPTRDILMELGARKRPGQILVGFAAETDHLLQNARRKLLKKNLDWIVANRVGFGRGFESDLNRVLMIPAAEKPIGWPLCSKKKIAERLIDLIAVKTKIRAGH